MFVGGWFLHGWRVSVFNCLICPTNHAEIALAINDNRIFLNIQRKLVWAYRWHHGDGGMFDWA